MLMSVRISKIQPSQSFKDNIEFIKCELCRLDSEPRRCNSFDMDVNKTDKFMNAKR